MRSFGAAVLTCLLLAGCAGSRTPWPAGTAGDLPRQVRVAAVPFVPQDEGHCGPAALAMVLQWSGAETAADELAAAVFTPGRGGSLEQDMATGGRAHGRLVVPVRGLEPLLREVAAGHPAVVLQNLGLAWWPQWHYAVVLGYDLDGGRIVLHSGTEAGRSVDLQTFHRTFERAGSHALIILPPERLPASADQGTVLQAAAGLERAGRAGAAARAYEAVLERWPRSLGGRLGLANARLASSDLGGAEDILTEASVIHPESAAAWNNLAHVLLLQHRLDAAERAAAQAVALGGDSADIARLTLEEIRSARAGAA